MGHEEPLGPHEVKLDVGRRIHLPSSTRQETYVTCDSCTTENVVAETQIEKRLESAGNGAHSWPGSEQILRENAGGNCLPGSQ